MEVAGSVVEMSCDDQVVVGVEVNDCDVVEGVDTDVSKEVDIVVDCETLSNVGMDGDGFPSPAAGLALSEGCPEIAASS